MTKAFKSFIRCGRILLLEQQLELVIQYNGKDIKDAIFSIDGTSESVVYISDFFVKAWSVVGADMTDAILEFFRNDKLLK